MGETEEYIEQLKESINKFEPVSEEGTEVVRIENYQINKNADSLEIGTPSKGGAIKIYCDFNDVEACKQKIRNAREVRDFGETELKY
jgi:hypothetical protein